MPLYAEPFDAVVPVSHRLADAAEVPLAELAKDPWIGPYPGNPCHEVVVLACESAGFQPRLEHSSDDFRAVVALASADAGVALVPRSALRGMDLKGVVVRPWTEWLPHGGSSRRCGAVLRSTPDPSGPGGAGRSSPHISSLAASPAVSFMG